MAAKEHEQGAELAEAVRRCMEAGKEAGRNHMV